MKRFGIIISFILLLLAWGLWYVGGQKVVYNYQIRELGAEVALVDKPIQLKTADRNSNNIADWQERVLPPKLIAGNEISALVLGALNQKKNPLLPTETVPASKKLTYNLSDLKIIDETNELALTAYAKSLVNIMSTYHSPGLGHEVTVALKMSSTGVNQAAMAEIEQAIARYQKTTADLLALAVPKAAAQIHLNLINDLALLSKNAWVMTKLETEPIVALSAVQIQTNYLRKFLNTITNTNLFFSINKLAVVKDSGGTITFDL